MHKLLAAAAITIAASGAAHAADLGKTEFKPAIAGHPIWSGAYVGAQFGGAIENTELADTGLSFGSKGIYGGLTVGYDIPLGGDWVGGVYASANYADLGASFLGLEYSQRWGSKIGGRLGKAAGSTLFYVPVAYTMDFNDFSGIDAANFRPGVYAGLGVEQAFLNGWSLGLEAGGKWSGQTLGAIDTDTQAISAELIIRKHF